MKKAEICRILKSRNYDPDPIMKWKQRISRTDGHSTNDIQENNEESEETNNDGKDGKNDYDYLLGMPIWNLTMEKKEDILKQQKQKGDELARLKAKTPNELWLDDLEHFLSELDKYEAKEREDDSVSQLKAFKASLSSKNGNGARAKASAFSKTAKLEYLPTDDAEKVDPEIDSALLKSVKDPETVKIKKESTKELNIVDLITNTSDEIKKLNNQEIDELANKLTKAPVKVKAEATEKGAKKTKVKVEEKMEVDNDDEIVLDEDHSGKATKVKSEPKVPRKKASPKAKNTINKYFGKKKGSESETSDISFKDDLSEDDDAPVERIKPARARKEVKYEDDESTKSDDEMKIKSKKNDDSFVVSCSDEDEPKPKKKSPKPVEKKSLFKSKTNLKEDKDEPKKKAAKKIKSDDEDTENKPVLKKNMTKSSSISKFAPAAKKSKKIETESETEVIDDSDSEFELPKSKNKKKLMNKNNDSFDIFKKAATAKAKKVVKDDDLYEIE